MLRTLLCSLLVVVVGACGGAPTAEPTAGASVRNDAADTAPAANPCPFEAADVARMRHRRVAGIRMAARIPDGSVQLVGMPTFVHECGVAVVFAETPPALEPAQRDEFSQGLVHGILEAPTPQAASCEPLAPATWRCPRNDAVLRVVNDGGVRGIVQVTGPGPIAEAIAASVTSSADAEWDPVKAMRLGLAPVEGFEMRPLSSPPLVTFGVPADEEAPTSPQLHWRFVPYVAHPDHTDGSAWTDRELGQQLGQEVVTQMGADPQSLGNMETRVLRETQLGQDLELVGTATVQDRPIRFYGAFLRENIGVFLIVGRAPEADAPMWVGRFQRHVGSFRVLD